MQLFVDKDPGLDTSWRSIILLGRNVASYKFALKNEDILNVEKICITASGGPFLNTSLKKLEKVKLSQALKHPNWKMGKKISIDSATLINKVYELIEAKKIFDLDYSKFDILIQPTSYVHSIIRFYGGIIKVLIHDTSMTIPIFNSLYENENFKKTISTKINMNLLWDEKCLDFGSPVTPSYTFLSADKNFRSFFLTSISFFDQRKIIN